MEPGITVSRGSTWARRAIHRVLGVCAVNRRHVQTAVPFEKSALYRGVLRLLVLELSPVAASLESTVQHAAVWLGAGQVLVIAAFDRGTANRAYGDGVACGLRLRSRKPAPAKAAWRVRFL